MWFGKSGLASFLALPLIVMLGEASYAVYLYRTPLVRLFDHLMPNLYGSRFSAFVPAATAGSELPFAALIALAVASVRWFERPMRIWLRQITSRDFSVQSAHALDGKAIVADLVHRSRWRLMPRASVGHCDLARGLQAGAQYIARFGEECLLPTNHLHHLPASKR